MTPPTNRRRALWVATGVAGLTGVVGLAALGGLAARDNKSDDSQRASENHAAAPKKVSDAGKAAEEKDGTDASEQKPPDQRGRDEHGRVREVPCDDEKLIEAVDLANRDHGGTLKLARDCTYRLDRYDKKTGTGLPTIRQAITIKGDDSTIKRDSEDAFRIFRVADGGNLTLKDLTLKDGNAARLQWGPQGPQGAPGGQGGQGGQAPEAAHGAAAPAA
ncbi:hypothetical protein ACIQG9_25275, partial [Micromonospora sp. NPDC092111]